MEKIERIPSWTEIEVIDTKYGTFNIYLSSVVHRAIDYPDIYIQQKECKDVDGKEYCISLRYTYEQHPMRVLVAVDDADVTKDCSLDQVSKKECDTIIEYFDVIVAEWINNDFDCKYNNYMHVALNNKICDLIKEREVINEWIKEKKVEINKYKYTPKVK